jgi:hypothetical protein
MSNQTHTLKKRLTASVSAVLFCWLLLNSSNTTLAEGRRDDWNGRSRFTAGRSTCRGGYNQARRDQDYRYSAYNRDRTYNGYQTYNGSRASDYNSYRDYSYDSYDGYRDYQERSKTQSAMIIAGSSAAGAGTGAIIGGGKGAVIGAIAGGVAGYIYDRKTNNR